MKAEGLLFRRIKFATPIHTIVVRAEPGDDVLEVMLVVRRVVRVRVAAAHAVEAPVPGRRHDERGGGWRSARETKYIYDYLPVIVRMEQDDVGLAK